jgi:signal transduction histidine kinase
MRRDRTLKSKTAWRSLALAFAAVIALFVLSTSFSEFTARSIDASATDIAQNAAPSIQHLANARAELRNLELTADSYVDGLERGEDDRTAAQASWNTVLQEYEAYQRLASFPGEREMRIELSRDLRRLEATLGQLFSLGAAKQPAEARAIELKVLYPLVEQTLDASLGLIELNSQQAAQLALKVERARNRSSLFAFGLDAISGLLAIALGLLATREVRRYSALLEDRNRLAAQRADELEQFAGRVAHDVLSPLMVVGLALDMNERLPPEDPRRLESVKRGKAALGRVRSIVDGLLAFARAGANPEPGAFASVRDVVDGLLMEVQPAAEAQDITLTTEGSFSQFVACSPGVLASALSNLVRNAIKYIGEGPERRVSIRGLELGAMVRLEVEDSGPGLPPGMEQRAWEPYVRAKGATQPGIGLGLATVKKIAEAHGGRVGVRSRPGEGALFWMELPRVGPASSSQEVAAPMLQ